MFSFLIVSYYLFPSSSDHHSDNQDHHHLGVKVTIPCHPIPLRSWLQPVHVLKEGLLGHPGDGGDGGDGGDDGDGGDGDDDGDGGDGDGYIFIMCLC